MPNRKDSSTEQTPCGILCEHEGPFLTSGSTIHYDSYDGSYAFDMYGCENLIERCDSVGPRN